VRAALPSLVGAGVYALLLTLGQRLLNDPEFAQGPKFHLQSWFSTDLIAHAQGVGSPQYLASRNQALRAAMARMT